MPFPFLYSPAICEWLWKKTQTEKNKTKKPNFGPQWKDRESSYQVRQILGLFCELVALILG